MNDQKSKGRVKSHPIPISVAELQSRFGQERIPYEQLLLTKEWAAKREKIIDRDSEKCSACGIKVVGTQMFEVPTASFQEFINYCYDLDGKGCSINPGDLEIKAFHLQVHHKLYIRGKYPWEYDDEALITLCNWCHFELHRKEIIPVYTEVDGQLMQEQFKPCPRCSGAGWLPQYKHVEDGVCFQCWGARYLKKLI